MYRFRKAIIRFESNSLQSFLFNLKAKPTFNRSLTFAANRCSHSSAIDVSKTAFNKNLVDIREKRLQMMKRNTPSNDFDVLSEAIIKSESIEQILSLISMHASVMNNKHLSDVFESVHDLIRVSHNPSEDTLKVLSSQQFIQLCNQSVRRMRFFQTSEILTTLKSLILLNVSPNTTIVQSLLQMTRQLINDFSLNEVIFLDFLLNKKFIDRTEGPNSELDVYSLEAESVDENKPKQREVIVPLVEALKLALPLVLQLKIESKELDYDDIDLVVRCLRTASKHNLKDEVLNNLAGAVSLKLDDLTIGQMYSVIASLISIQFANSTINTNLVNRVVNQCLDRVTAPGTAIPYHLSNFVISLIINTKSRRDFYHKGLYELVANLIIQNPNRFHNSKACAVLWALSRHSHVHYGLLDYLSDKIAIREPDLIANTKTSFTNILSAFALPSNYRPNEPNSELIYKTILDSNHIKLCQQKTKHLLFKTLRHLSVLNYYPKQELREWMHKYFNDALSSSTLLGLRIEFLEGILILYQGLCLESEFTDCEDLKQNLKQFVEELNAFQLKDLEYISKSESLQFALAQGLGGKQFVVSNLLTDFGHLVDHVVVLRKDGFPVPIGDGKDKSTHIRQLNVPTDAKIIGIIPLTPKDFCREPYIRKAETDFRLRTLRKCGITPIAIHLDGWESLAEIEKIPYIMREIQEIIKIEKQSKIP